MVIGHRSEFELSIEYPKPSAWADSFQVARKDFCRYVVDNRLKADLERANLQGLSFVTNIEGSSFKLWPVSLALWIRLLLELIPAEQLWPLLWPDR